MINQQDNAAFALVGMTLNQRWKVIKRIEPLPGASGGFFSVCYIVEDGQNIAFLKALNFKAFFQLFKGKSVVEILNERKDLTRYMLSQIDRRVSFDLQSFKHVYQK